MNNSGPHTDPDKKKKAGLLDAVFWFISIYFYAFKILKDYFMYKQLADLVKSEPYIKETAVKHRKMVFVFMFVHILSLAIPAYIIKNIEHTKNVDSVMRQHKMTRKLYDKNKLVRKIDNTLSKYVSTFQKRRKAQKAALISLAIMGINFLYFSVLSRFHPAREGSMKLKKALIAEGLHHENDGKLCLAIDCGYYIDITGHGAKEVAQRESLWKRLSVAIDDHKQYENREENTKVFFVRKFSLKDKYDFSL